MVMNLSIDKIYNNITLDQLQEFTNSYLAWYVKTNVEAQDNAIQQLRSQLQENDRNESALRPTSSELYAIESLQDRGVTDIDLLDQIIEKGENWVSLTINRLQYFENAGLAPSDYVIWCQHALSGAYDWINPGQMPVPGPAVEESLSNSVKAAGNEEQAESTPEVQEAPDTDEEASVMFFNQDESLQAVIEQEAPVAEAAVEVPEPQEQNNVDSASDDDAWLLDSQPVPAVNAHQVENGELNGASKGSIHIVKDDE